MAPPQDYLQPIIDHAEDQGFYSTSVDLSNPGPIGATTPNAATFTTVDVENTTPSTNPTTGALTVAGGLGVAGNLNVGGDTALSGNFTLASSAPLDAIDACLSPNALMVANNIYVGGNRISALSGLFADRMFGATARYNFTSSGFVTPENAFNKTQNSFATLQPGQTGVMEFELQSNNSSFINYARCLYFVSFHWSRIPASYTVELQTNGTTWRTVRNRSNPAIIDIFIDTDTAYASVTRMRITVVAGASEAWLSNFECFPKRPTDTELQQFIPLYSPTQLELFSPALAVRGVNRDGNQSVLGAGTLSANDLPEYASDAAAAADGGIPSGTFYTLTGDTAVRCKP